MVYHMTCGDQWSVMPSRREKRKARQRARYQEKRAEILVKQKARYLEKRSEILIKRKEDYMAKRTEILAKKREDYSKKKLSGMEQATSKGITSRRVGVVNSACSGCGNAPCCMLTSTGVGQ